MGESAIHTMHAEIDDMLHQAKNSEEKSKKAMVDAARLADELRAEQEHSTSQEKTKRSLESQVMELDQRLAEANESAAKKLNAASRNFNFNRRKTTRIKIVCLNWRPSWPSIAKLNKNLKRLKTGPKLLEINYPLFGLPQLACNGHLETGIDHFSNVP